jgi:hypothetical protein
MRKKTIDNESMPNRSFLFLITILVTVMLIGLVLYLTRKDNPDTPPDASVGKTKQTLASDGTSPLSRLDSRAAPSPVAKSSLAPKGPRPILMRTSQSSADPEPEYEVKVARHRAIQSFFNSPARDTQECREMLRLLTEHGYGIDQLELVYQAAWSLRMKDLARSKTEFFSADGKKLDASVPEIQAAVAQMLLRAKDEQAKLLKQQGIDNPELLAALLGIRPKVLWEHQAVDGEISEANLLHDQQLTDYLNTHRIKDLSWEEAEALNKATRSRAVQAGAPGGTAP